MPKHLAQRVSTRKASDVLTWKRCNKSFSNKSYVYILHVCAMGFCFWNMSYNIYCREIGFEKLYCL